MKAIDLVLIGLGNMGRYHLKAILEDKRFKLAAIVDPSIVEMPQTPYPVKHIHDIDHIESIDFDAAIVAAPTEFHASITRKLLLLDKHVLVEKPAASTLVQAQDLVSLAKSNGCKLAVGHIERCNPAVDALAEVLELNVIGTPVHVAANRCGAYPKSVNPGNQVFLDLAVHELDVLVRLFSHLDVKEGFYHCLENDSIPDMAEVRLTSSSGCQATIHVNWFTPQKLRVLRVTATRGVAELDYMTQTLRIYGNNLVNVEKLSLEAEEQPHPFCRLVELKIPRGQPIQRQLGQFYAMLTDQKHNLCTGREILDSLSLLDDCLKKSGPAMSKKSLTYSQDYHLSSID